MPNFNIVFSTLIFCLMLSNKASSNLLCFFSLFVVISF